MTLLAMDYSARVEECADLKVRRPWEGPSYMRAGTSLVHLLYDPSDVDPYLLRSAEWQQILPFLAQIGCNLELRNGEGQTPFLVAATYLNFRCIQELSKQGADFCMTIMALLTAGCDPRTSSKWAKVQELWPGSKWDLCDSAFRALGWTTQDIDELVDNNQSSSKSRYTRTPSPNLSYTITRDNSREASPSEIAVQSIEEDEYEGNKDPSRSDPGLSLDRASSFTPFKRPKIWERREDQGSLSPITDVSSPNDARTPPDDPGQGNDNAHDLPEPFRNLDLGPDDIVTDEHDNLLRAGPAYDHGFDQSPHIHTPRYFWKCCYCDQINGAALNSLCIGQAIRGELCEHRCCKDCSIDKVIIS
jgi:hypothetical protein